jgi:hypothetical protein
VAGCVLCALASAAPAQDPQLDLALVDVQVLVLPEKSTSFQILPTIHLDNGGNLASHALDLAMYYAPIGLQILSDTVTYIQNNHDCWQQPITQCGDGNCLDIYTGLGWLDGFCSTSGFLWNCGCLYVINKEFEPVPYSLGYNTVTVTLDPYNLVPEADETNNEMTIDLGPIANDFVTWSGIKSMYR